MTAQVERGFAAVGGGAHPPAGALPALQRWLERLPLRSLAVAGSIGLLLVAILVLAQEIGSIEPGAIAAAIGEVPASHILLGLAFTAASYLALTLYDLFALRHIGRRDVPLRSVIPGAFAAFAISYTIGFAFLVSGAVRYRAYRRHGVTAGEIARLVAVSAVTLWLGVIAVLGFGLILEGGEVSALDGLSLSANHGLGALALLAVAGYLVFVGTGARRLGSGAVALALPGARSTFAQLMIGAADVTFAAAALYVLLPADGGPGFATFAALFVVAMALGMASHAPGGAGVIEATLFLTLPGIAHERLVAALLLWRVIYYLLPAALASLLLLVREWSDVRPRVAAGARRVARLLRPAAPTLIAGLVVLGGIVLLVSGVTPELDDRMHMLKHVVPLPFVEASHLLGSVIGLVLLVIAVSLAGRLHSAYLAARALLAAGLVFSLAKGFDVEEATILGAVLALLILERRAFFRRGSLFDHKLGVGWLVAIGTIVVGAIAIGFFSYQDVDYSNDLWWDFAYHGNAPRFLRAALAISVVAMALAVHTLLRRPARPPAQVTDLEKVRAIVARGSRSEANLAFVGDKRFLFAPEGDAFIMYQVRGKSWIAMGDPVGAPERAPALIRAFCDLADAHAGWPVFYQTSVERLPLYLDEGFALLKLGEEARVPLDRFTTEGKAGYDHRYALRRAEREDLVLEIVPPEGFEAILPEIEAVSDAWLEDKGVAEKSFSLGSFDAGYLRHFPTAVLRKEGRIVAFANLWASGDGSEHSVDLMRHRPDAPKGVMDALFVMLMLRAKAAGGRWFNLGMAPLSGLATHGRAPAWNRLGAFVARRGEDLYNFGGLRAFKSKYDPVWEPRYLACPRGLAVPRVLLDVTSLVSGGLVEAVRKSA